MGRFVTGESYARRSLEICDGASDAPEEEIADSTYVLTVLLAVQGGSAESECVDGSSAPRSPEK